MATFQEIQSLLLNYDWTSVPINPLQFIDFVKTENALITNSILTALTAFLCYVFSVILGNLSMVDMIWSIVPAIYAAVFAYHHPSPRVLLMAALITIWACRLTWNLWLKDGYNVKFEDYRWEWIRQNWFNHPIPIQFFNLFFVAIYQNILLLLIVSPMFYVAAIEGNVSSPLTTWDYVSAFVAVSLLVIETTADLQQRYFRIERDLRRKTGKIVKGDEYDAGFCQTGLWYFSRHPNFFSEFSFWWAIYSFSVIVKPTQIFNWTLVGTALLTSLFQGSTWLTEKILLGKYPKYHNYVNTTSIFVPLPKFGNAKKSE